jgi:hypothetical protein
MLCVPIGLGDRYFLVDDLGFAVPIPQFRTVVVVGRKYLKICQLGGILVVADASYRATTTPP